MEITYSKDPSIDLKQVMALYKQSFKESPRPIHDINQIQRMFLCSNLLVSAWDKDQLVGVCRCFSDFSYVTYICDLAVHENYQNKKIGQTLIEMVKTESGKSCKIVLLSNKKANSFYPHIGFSSHDRAWVIDPQE